MGKLTQLKLVLRSALLILATFVIVSDTFSGTNYAYFFLELRFFKIISLIHIFWLTLMIEMLVVLIPKFNVHTYSGKHLLKHYISVVAFDIEVLKRFTKNNAVKAGRSSIFWILFNTPFAVLYFMGVVDYIFFYWLFFFYYFFDVFSMQVFCIFHLFVTKNKCCNECRIFNWGHFMYCTPLIFIPNFWNYSLLLLSIAILVQWELSIFKYPERFSPITNEALQCTHCNHACRFNKKKRVV